MERNTFFSSLIILLFPICMRDTISNKTEHNKSSQSYCILNNSTISINNQYNISAKMRTIKYTADKILLIDKAHIKLIFCSNNIEINAASAKVDHKGFAWIKDSILNTGLLNLIVPLIEVDFYKNTFIFKKPTIKYGELTFYTENDMHCVLQDEMFHSSIEGVSISSPYWNGIIKTCYFKYFEGQRNCNIYDIQIKDKANTYKVNVEKADIDKSIKMSNINIYHKTYDTNIHTDEGVMNFDFNFSFKNPILIENKQIKARIASAESIGDFIFTQNVEILFLHNNKSIKSKTAQIDINNGTLILKNGTLN